MNQLIKKIEVLSNLAILLVAILLGIVLVRNYLLPGLRPQSATSSIQAGTKLSIPGVNWNASGKTLVMALSTQCHFCTESAPFYQRVVQSRAQVSNFQLVAAFPQNTSDAEHYLKDLGIGVDDIKQVRLDSLGVRGTPTLVLTDQQGGVIQSWFGKLSANQEQEVLDRLR